jgi:hypothetical protein
VGAVVDHFDPVLTVPVISTGSTANTAIRSRRGLVASTATGRQKHVNRLKFAPIPLGITKSTRMVSRLAPMVVLMWSTGRAKYHSQTMPTVPRISCQIDSGSGPGLPNSTATPSSASTAAPAVQAMTGR